MNSCFARQINQKYYLIESLVDLDGRRCQRSIGPITEKMATRLQESANAKIVVAERHVPAEEAVANYRRCFSELAAAVGEMGRHITAEGEAYGAFLVSVGRLDDANGELSIDWLPKDEDEDPSYTEVVDAVERATRA